MCGITGMIDASKQGFYKADTDTFFGLLLINSLRGASSTGAFGINKSNKTDVFKAVGNPYEWNSWKVADDWTAAMVRGHNIVVGHGRAPTFGEPSIDNAHPFEYNGITLVHNGTLRNFKELQAKHKTEFEVDSQLITYLIAEIGIEETIKEIKGAYALVWHDEKHDGLFVLRNSERPLLYVMGSGKNKMVIGSERHYFHWAVQKFWMQDPTITEFPTDMLHHIQLEDSKIKMTVKRVAGSFQTYSYSGGRGGYQGYHNLDYVEGDVEPPVRKKPTSIVTPPAKQAVPTIVCVGEDIVFNVSEIRELPDDKRQKTPYIIKGIHPDEPNIEIIGYTFEDLTDLDSEDVKNPPRLQGKVQKLIILNSDTNYTVRVFIDKPKRLAEEVNVVTLPLIEQTVILKDKQKISVNKFLALASDGCYCCQSKPSIAFAPQCTYDIRNVNGTEHHIFLCPVHAGESNDGAVLTMH